MSQLDNGNPMPDIEDTHTVRFNSTDEVSNNYREEAERAQRSDHRYNEDILRDENVTSTESGILQVIDNLGNLAACAENMALSNVNWNPNDPFTLMRNIFESLVKGWKETLIAAQNWYFQKHHNEDRYELLQDK
jgi:hypothetical protein